MSRRCDDVLGPCDNGCDLCTPTLRHAIRHAIPKLSAIADFAESRRTLGVVATAGDLHLLRDDIREVVADLLSALDGSEGASGTTTAQEGQEGRSGRNSGVSGETVPCWPCGQPVHVERLDNGKTYTTDPDGTPHTCHPADIHENRRTPHRPQETA